MPTPDIVLVTIEYPPQHGGVARYLHSLVRESQGQLRVVDARPLFRAAWPTWWPIVSLCRAQKDATILVSHVFPVGTAAWISRLFGGPKYAVIFHGLDVRRARGFWKRFLLRRICHGAKTLLVNSRATGRDLRKVVPDVSAVVITPGVEFAGKTTKTEARHALDLDPEAPLVISIARLVSRKGIDVALRAMARIQKKGDGTYVVVGDGEERERLENLAAELGVRVRWVVDAEDAEKWMWLSAADVFLLPVRDEGDDVEGFGIVFLEAASVGVPSVAGRSGGAVEAVVDGETGLLVDPTSVEEVQNAVMKLLRDPALREQYGAAAKVRAEMDFRWNVRWDKLKRNLS